MIHLPPVIGLGVAVTAFILPGLALARGEEWREGDVIGLAAIAAVGSVAWFAVGIWFIGFLHLPLSVFAIVSSAASLAILARWRRHDIAIAASGWRRDRRAVLLALAFVAGVLLTRALFAFTRLGFSVTDMSAHAYMSELIVMRDGLPDTYAPFLPIGDFGSFPPGFHTVSAIETLLGGIPTYRSTIHVLCLSLAALTFALYALLRGIGVGRAGSALGAAGALMLSRNPQFFELWGGAPTLLAGAIAMLLFRDSLRLAGPCDAGFLARLALFGAATLLVHQLLAVTFVYVMVAVAALIARRDRRAWTSLARNGGAVAVMALGLSVPFLLRLPRNIPPEARAFAHEWFRSEVERSLRLQTPILARLGAGHFATEVGPQTWPFYLIVFLGVLPVLLLIAGLVVRWRRQRGPATTIATTLVVVYLVLFAGGLTETLPLWPSLYPTRTGVWLMPALGVAIAGLASWLGARLSRRTLTTACVAWLALFVVEGFRLSGTKFDTAFYESTKTGRSSIVTLVANEALAGAFWVSTFNRENSVLTPDDLRAFSWAQANTPDSAVFATNLGDGGSMITAIAHRRITKPHFNLAFFFAKELEWWSRTPVDYVYVGSQSSPPYPRQFTAEQLDRDPAFELVLRSGDARIYRVRNGNRTAVH